MDRRAGLAFFAFFRRADMEAEQDVHVVNGAAPDHGQGAGAQFFRRLKNHFQPTLFYGLFLEQFFGGRQNHRGMGVMAAGVAGAMHAVNHMAEGVHVGAQGQGRSGDAAVEYTDDSRGVADIAGDCETRRLQLIRQIGGGFYFLKADFRDSMQMMISFQQQRQQDRLLIVSVVFSPRKSERLCLFRGRSC